MVMVTASRRVDRALEDKGYDVGFVGELNEAAVYVTCLRGAAARRGLQDRRDGRGREHAPRRQGRDRGGRRGRAARGERRRRTGTKAGKAKGAVNVPGNVVIQRAYTFTNYAGRFLYVEAHNKLHGDTTGPAMSFTYTSPNGTSQVYNLSNSTISPDGNDSDASAATSSRRRRRRSARYMYHRGLVALLRRQRDAGGRRHLRPRR